MLVRVYGPLPRASLASVVRRLRFAVPQWKGELTSALRRAQQRLSHALVDGHDWFWPPEEHPASYATDNSARFLTPFDPIVWDRRRFELLWGWAYRFEAYTPVSKRMLGYYALPLLWRDRVIGWGNLSVENAELYADVGYVQGQAPADLKFRRALGAELERMRFFLGLKVR